jgi:hypothetical protein
MDIRRSFLKEKRLEHEAANLPTPTAEVKTGWNFASTPSYDITE